MDNNRVTAIPDEYFHAVHKELQGTLAEVTYPVKHYINAARQLVTDQEITQAMAGRETVGGEAILKKCNVYLPAGYDPEDGNRRYNVLYLLHGVGGNRYEWLCGSGNIDGNHVICNLLDHMISKGDIEPLIVVFPDGRSACDWTDTSFNAEGTNLLGFYYFDYELRYDLIPYIESQYPTWSDIRDRSQEKIEFNRRHRAVAGLSMGGMQALNLVLGGYRYDSIQYTKSSSRWKNGLDMTVPAPGMLDLFAYVGAFSNAPTTSAGEILGAGPASGQYKLEVLYLTCGDADGVAYHAGYKTAVEGLAETAGDMLGELYEVVIKDGAHDFPVWNNGAYNFLRILSGHPREQAGASVRSRITI